jgi:hypothetical protein
VIDRRAGKIDVRVHQLVKSLGGDVLLDREVWHSYTIANGLIERMDIEEKQIDSEQNPEGRGCCVDAGWDRHFLPMAGYFHG